MSPPNCKRKHKVCWWGWSWWCQTGKALLSIIFNH